MNVSTWHSATHIYQFILGPVGMSTFSTCIRFYEIMYTSSFLCMSTSQVFHSSGSGAPFHFHCNAVNALIYGRKKWVRSPITNLWYDTDSAGGLCQFASSAKVHVCHTPSWRKPCMEISSQACMVHCWSLENYFQMYIGGMLLEIQTQKLLHC